MFAVWFKRSVFIFIFCLLSLAVFSLTYFWPKIIHRDVFKENNKSISFAAPWRNYNEPDLALNAKAALSLEYEGGIKHVLFAKNQNEKLAIASLTKILSSYIALLNYDLEEEIVFSEKAINIPEQTGFFSSSEKFFLKDLLYSVLVESSNDAIWAISEEMGTDSFVSLMNQKAGEMKMNNSSFFDPVGLDPSESGNYNFSTANDISEMLMYLLDQFKKDLKSSILFEMMRAKEYDLYDSKGVFHHKAISTNRMLFDGDSAIFGGKTGSSPLAQECLVIVMRHPKYQNGYIINVLLGSDNRFEDMDRLVSWLNKAYLIW